MEKLYTIQEVADYFKCGKNAVYKWMQSGKIKTTRTPGGDVRITQSEIERTVKG